jgi:hypothetical protein
MAFPLSWHQYRAFLLFIIQPTTAQFWGPGYRSRCSDSLRAGRSGDRIPVGGEIFRTRPDRPWGPPSLLYNGYRVFPGGKAAGAWCWQPTPICMPRSWKGRAIPLLTLWAFVACYRENFTFHLLLHNFNTFITYNYIRFAPTCFDVNTSSSGSPLCLAKITYIVDLYKMLLLKYKIIIHEMLLVFRNNKSTNIV